MGDLGLPDIKDMIPMTTQELCPDIKQGILRWPQVSRSDSTAVDCGVWHALLCLRLTLSVYWGGLWATSEEGRSWCGMNHPSLTARSSLSRSH